MIHSTDVGACLCIVDGPRWFPPPHRARGGASQGSREQLLKRPLGDDHPPRHDHNLIRPARGCASMRDDEAGQLTSLSGWPQTTDVISSGPGYSDFLPNGEKDRPAIRYCHAVEWIHGGLMLFEWDADKNEASLVKHGISFVAAANVFDDPRHIELDSTRPEHGELCGKTIGMVGSKLFAVVYTDRGDVRRIISARSARANEQREYDQGEEGG